MFGIPIFMQNIEKNFSIIAESNFETIHSRLNFVQSLINFPPILCRLLARHKNGPPLSTEEIVQRSAKHSTLENALGHNKVEYISDSDNWRGIEIFDALAFMHGCRVDLTNPKNVRWIKDYLSKTPSLKYLRTSADWQTSHLPRLIKWRKSYGKTISNSVTPPIRNLLERLTPVIHEDDRKRVLTL